MDDYYNHIVIQKINHNEHVPDKNRKIDEVKDNIGVIDEDDHLPKNEIKENLEDKENFIVVVNEENRNNVVMVVNIIEEVSRNDKVVDIH